MDLELDVGEQALWIIFRLRKNASDIDGSDVILVLELFC